MFLYPALIVSQVRRHVLHTVLHNVLHTVLHKPKEDANIDNVDNYNFDYDCDYDYEVSLFVLKMCQPKQILSAPTINDDGNHDDFANYVCQGRWVSENADSCKCKFRNPPFTS